MRYAYLVNWQQFVGNCSEKFPSFVNPVYQADYESVIGVVPEQRIANNLAMCQVVCRTDRKIATFNFK
jgi:hypothetical protein